MNALTINNQSIIWQDYHLIKHLLGKGNLLKSLFNVSGVKTNKIGLHVQLNNKEVDILWIDAVVYYTDLKNSYAEYIEDMYVIKGATFDNKEGMLKVYDFLEKKLVWKILND